MKRTGVINIYPEYKDMLRKKVNEINALGNEITMGEYVEQAILLKIKTDTMIELKKKSN